jgi:UDP-GlcNAc:undecaprenyl-phosphate GlcNAc-1-phosphate transferase
VENLHELPWWSFYLLVFGISLAFALLFTPIAKRLALYFDIVDRPGGRKIHTTVVPYLGGLAIYAAFWLGVAVSMPNHIQQLAAIVFAGTLVMLLGLWDDRNGMSPVMKLAGQGVAALIVVLSGILFEVSDFAIINLAVSLVWMVGLSNAMNLLDNMDGLSGGATLICAFFLFLLSVLNGQYLVSGMSLSLMGACLGFLHYNFAPASIFMGDAGSLFLGFMTSVLAIKLRPAVDGESLQFIVAVTMLGLPILDTTLVTVHRLLNGRAWYEGGKDHLSHRLVLMGLTRINAVLVLYAVAASYGFLAVLLNAVGPHPLILALAVVYSLFLFVGFSQVNPYENAPPPQRPSKSTNEDPHAVSALEAVLDPTPEPTVGPGH